MSQIEKHTIIKHVVLSLWRHAQLIERINREVVAQGHLSMDWYGVLTGLIKPEQRFA
jgi:hypothetical protein